MSTLAGLDARGALCEILAGVSDPNQHRCLEGLGGMPQVSHGSATLETHAGCNSSASEHFASRVPVAREVPSEGGVPQGTVRAVWFCGAQMWSVWECVHKRSLPAWMFGWEGSAMVGFPVSSVASFGKPCC